MKTWLIYQFWLFQKIEYNSGKKPHVDIKIRSLAKHFKRKMKISIKAIGTQLRWDYIPLYPTFHYYLIFSLLSAIFFYIILPTAKYFIQQITILLQKTDTCFTSWSQDVMECVVQYTFNLRAVSREYVVNMELLNSLDSLLNVFIMTQNVIKTLAPQNG